MRAVDVFVETPITPPVEDFEILGVTHDSRQVRPGDLFVALEGEFFDGRRFAAEASGRGAVGVVGRGEKPEGFDGRWLQIDDPRRWFGPLATAVYGHPDRQLTLVGVTGTNGKSTIVNVMRQVLEAAGRPCASLGTLGYTFRDVHRASARTTPEAGELCATLRQAVDGGAAAVVMEVSSHALVLGRVDGLEYDVALFTNLTRDHLDFHGDLENYFEAKSRLFSRLKKDGRSVVNVDDDYGVRLAGLLEEPLTYGAEGEVRILSADLGESGTIATIGTPRGTLEIRSSLLGRYNLENTLAVVATAEALGLSHRSIAAGIAACAPITGRMESIDCGQPFPVYIDYAHTHRALAAALDSLAEFSGRKIVLVFGCGGNRDQGKRRLMGRVAGERADLAILTNDNPRTEDPAAIIAEVRGGLEESGSSEFTIVENRAEAIRQAVAHADSGWAVLIAGKGHEEEQIIGRQTIPFSDRQEIVKALEERFGHRYAQ